MHSNILHVPHTNRSDDTDQRLEAAEYGKLLARGILLEEKQDGDLPCDNVTTVSPDEVYAICEAALVHDETKEGELQMWRAMALILVIGREHGHFKLSLEAVAALEEAIDCEDIRVRVNLGLDGSVDCLIEEADRG